MTEKTIKQIQAEKVEVESKIASLLIEFSISNNVKIDDIDLDVININDIAGSKIYKVRLDIKL